MLPRFLIAAVLLAATPLARAAESSATLAGARLVIDSPCAREVDVQPDPSLHDQVRVTASAEHVEELDNLLLEGGAAVRLRAKPGNCWRPGLFGEWRPTLHLAVRVPPRFAVSIDESSAASYTLGAIDGSLAIDLSGAGDAAAQRVTDLKVDLSGMGHIRVASVTGRAKMELSGAGGVTLDAVSAPSLAADISGAGALEVGKGDIGQAMVESSGVGSVRIGAVVGGAHVDLSGMGSVRFARVTGQLDKEMSGLGSVIVGQ